MRVLRLEGSWRQMGEAHGASCASLIHALYRVRTANAIEQARVYGKREVTEETILRLARGCLPIVEAYHPEGFEELCGIAEGSGLDLPKLWSMNNLTDMRDVLAFGSWDADQEGCSSFVVPARRSALDALVLGQSWDLATDNMPFVNVVFRRPDRGPATVSLTVAGCLTLIGMNDRGVAIGTTNLRTVDSRKGVGYLDIIHKAIHCTNLEDAVRCVVDAPRAGAHFYFIGEASGAAAAIECTAVRSIRVDVRDEVYVHCNHLLHPAFRAVEAETPAASTHARQDRMFELLSSATERTPGARISVSDLQAFLADHHGTPNAICRHDVAGISSNGSVVMAPSLGLFWAVHGPACQGGWKEFVLAKE